MKLGINTQPKVEVVPPPEGVTGAGMVSAKNKYVQIYRPPVLLDGDGKTLPGTSTELMAGYLVSMVTRMVGTNFGAVAVDWTGREGRFVSTRFTLQTWGQSLDLLVPVWMISGELRDALDLYMQGMAEKVRQMHKGEQNYGRANDMITRAQAQIDTLRNQSDVPQFTEPEFLFIQKTITTGLTMSALLPVLSGDAQPTKSTVIGADGRKVKS